MHFSSLTTDILLRTLISLRPDFLLQSDRQVVLVKNFVFDLIFEIVAISLGWLLLLRFGIWSLIKDKWLDPLFSLHFGDYLFHKK